MINEEKQKTRELTARGSELIAPAPRIFSNRSESQSRRQSRLNRERQRQVRLRPPIRPAYSRSQSQLSNPPSV